MSFNLRLPQSLDFDARNKAEAVGISLNALICIAVAKYLKEDNSPSMVDLAPPPVRRERAVKTAKVVAGQPMLSSPPTKAELVALHNWEHDQKKKTEGDPAPDPSAWRGGWFRELSDRRSLTGNTTWLVP
jgi:hypothetical protein